MDIIPLYLAGKFIDTGNQLDVTSPYKNQVVARISLAGPRELDLAIQEACDARKAMAALSSGEKREKLSFIASRLKEQHDKFTLTICREAAKPFRYASAEVDRAIETFSIAAEEASRLPKEYISLDRTPPGRNREGLIKYFPAGVVAGITPFNFPLNLAVHKIAPALAAGCPIIIKPASKTPLSCLHLAEILHEAGWPAGAVSILPTDRDTGNLLIQDPRIAVLSFTGSPEVGWKMKAEAGKKKTVLELGGNAGVIVGSSADLDAAVEKCVLGGYAYSGQVCIHAQRIFVHQDLFNTFLDKFLARTAELKYGPPESKDTTISAMIDEANAKRVMTWVDEAVALGAKLLTGGKREGNFVEPVLLTNTNKAMKVHAEEVFGPVVTIDPFSTFEEAVEKINDTRFGLQAGVFTREIEEMDYAFNHLEVGGVILNDSPMLRFDNMPYGGIRESGYGREGVKYAMLDMLEARILVK